MNLHAASQWLNRTARTAIAALLVSGALMACAAPQGTPPEAQPAPRSTAPVDSGGARGQAPAPAATAPAPRGDDIAPSADSPSTTPVKIDTGCRTSADCTVKNVGNCCGYYPACVNVNSPTDPQGVQAECARSGAMSVCGFREISACQCVKGQCEPAAGGLDVQ